MTRAEVNRRLPTVRGLALVLVVTMFGALISAPTFWVANARADVRLASAQAAQSSSDELPSVVVGESFDGLARCFSHCVGPPNTQVAVNSAWIVEMVNNEIAVWPRSAPGGAPLWSEDDCQFLKIVDDYGFCGDPRLQYDPESGRFFALAEGESSFVVAVSATADPTGAWYRDTVQVPDGLDNTRLAITTDKVIVGDNGSDLWVFQKSDYLGATGEPVTARMVHTTTGNATVGVITLPIGNPDGPAGYAVSDGGSDTTAAQILQITGTPAAGNVRFSPTVLHTRYPLDDNVAVAAPQAGGPTRLAFENYYPLSGVEHAGSLWFPTNVSCTPPGDDTVRDCVDLTQVDVSGPTPALVDETEIAFPGEYLIAPTVAVDGQGRAVVVATETDPSISPSVVAVAVRADGTYGAPTVIRAGEGYSEPDLFAQHLTRWGDYSSAAVDPNDPATIWLGGEYGIDDSHYGTSISSVTVTDPGCPDGSTCAPGTYRPVPATRLLDTRNGIGGQTGRVGGGSYVAVPVTGLDGIPAQVSAVAVTVTVTSPLGVGYVTAYPDRGSPPSTSTVNFARGQTVANQAVVGVGTDGAIALLVGSASAADLILDVTGYYLPGSAGTPGALHPTVPLRILDTRTPGGSPSRVGLAGGATQRLHVAGLHGLPITVSAVAVNLTVTGAHTPGYLTAYPDGIATPATSNLNFVAGQSIANQAIVQVGSDGAIELHNGSRSPAQVIVDLDGYYLTGTPTAAGAYQPVTPTRVLDTRTGTGASGPVNPDVSVPIRVTGIDAIPPDASAVSVNLTATTPTTVGYLTAYPDGTPPPATSNLNFAAGQTAANLAIIQTGTDGTIRLLNGSTGTTHLIADITGYTLPTT